MAASGKEDARKGDLLRLSVVIPTQDRPEDLADLLLTVLDQTWTPFEVIVVDDSAVNSAKRIVDSLSSRFKTIFCRVRYIQGNGTGLATARNLGARLSGGDAVLFIDDDTQLERNLLYSLSAFLRDHPKAMGVQPQIYTLQARSSGDTKSGIENAINRVLMLSYFKQNTLAVRRSGASVFPYAHRLTDEIGAQRLDGCCMCYRRELFGELSFDANLRKWASMEDLDFSYRVFREYGGALHAIPHSAIIHKKSVKPGISSRMRIYMMTIYWFYVFFKDIFEGSLLNLVAFFWALTGNLIVVAGGLIVERKSKHKWLEFVCLVKSYCYALRHFMEIKAGNLIFFNRHMEE